MKKISTKDGCSISVKVNAIVANGIVVEVNGQTFFLSYQSYPWFANARITDVFQVEPVSNIGIRWNALDVDLALNSLIHPEQYPLTAKTIF